MIDFIVGIFEAVLPEIVIFWTEIINKFASKKKKQATSSLSGRYTKHLGKI